MNMGYFKGISDKKDVDPTVFNGWWNKLQAWWNEHDSGVRAWAKVSAGDLTLTGTITAPSLTAWVAYTPTFSAGWGTVSNKSFFWRRVGDTLEVHGTFTTGTVGASAGTITMPSGLVVDSTKLTGSSKDFIGICWDLEVGGSQTNHLRFLFWDGTTNTATLNDGTPGANAFSASNVNGTFANSVGATADFKVPIQGWTF